MDQRRRHFAHRERVYSRDGATRPPLEDRHVRRNQECPSAYRVYLLDPATPASAAAHSSPGPSPTPPPHRRTPHSFRAAEHRLCAALLGAPEFPNAVFPAAGDEGESPAKALRVETNDTAGEGLRAADAVVWLWGDSSLWELSHAALSTLRSRVDQRFHEERRSEPSAPGTGSDTAAEPYDAFAYEQCHNSVYRLEWWAGALSSHTGRSTFCFMGRVHCGQIFPEHPSVTLLEGGRDANSIVVAETNGFPGPGTPLFLSCRRLK